MDDDLVRIREARAALEAHDAARAAIQARSDQAIGEALDHGHTWVVVQEASGLSKRGLQLAVTRYRAGK